jgi:hypothetical protein
MATYGRSAWLSVGLVFATVLLWNSGKARSRIVFWLLVMGFSVVHIGLDSEFLKVNRIITRTQKMVDSPLDDREESERFMAYVEPFSHVMRHPVFFVAGSGAAQRKWGGNAYEEADTASHAIPGMAYYAYGVGGSICQILIMTSIGLFCSRRLRAARKSNGNFKWIWGAFLACWFGCLPWWCFDHGLLTQPRGSMVFFLFIGCIVACDGISRKMARVQNNTRFPEIPDPNLVNLQQVGYE